MSLELHLAPLILLVAYGVFARYKLLPNIDSLQQFASMLNSKGGNILILGTMSLYFFVTGIRMTYWCLEQAVAGKLSADNAVMMMGLTFVTGSCFGGAFSAMLKVMSGDTPLPTGAVSRTTEVKETVNPPQPQP